MSEPFGGNVVAGRYEIVRGIGRGSFGHTFLAHDRTLDRPVAIKLLDRRGDGDFKALELFEREASVLRSMRHHGVPEVFDLVRDDWNGAPSSFLVMEFVEGVSLGRMIDDRRQLDPADVMHLFLEMLGILEYLHSRVPPVVHRDIKPSNIVVRSDGRPALVDFGSVRRVFLAADEAGSTVVGTYGYMPYEQYMGQATPSSDLYSLAATFLQLLTGRPPREFMTEEGRIEVPEALPGDARLRPVIARMLRPSPTERFPDAVEVRRALLSPVAVDRVSGDGRVPARARQARVTLPPAPRPIEGDTKWLLKQLSPRALRLMDTTAKPGDSSGLFDWLSLGFFSVLTLGILPVVFVSASRARRRRLERFLRDGHPADARILSIDEETSSTMTLAKVAYEFEAEGALHRDVDKVLPMFANRWQPGDQVQVLYLPEPNFDSVIISPS